MVPLDGSPALRTSATARELERLRAKRRMLEAAAKSPSASVINAGFVHTQQLPTPTSANDPALRNARIKASARKLLDQLQAADTNLGDSSNSLKLLFAKQALRALADRQAAAAAEAHQRKLDKLKETLVEEHRRQQQLIQQQQQQEQPQPRKERSPKPEQSVDPRRRSKSVERHHRTSSRRRPSPKRHDGDEDLSPSGCGSFDSDTRTSDASSVRDTRRRPSRSRYSGHPRLRSQLAGPTETGVHGAVSAQALSALLAGLQLHGVNLTSGPPPRASPASTSAASTVITDPINGAAAPRSSASARRRSSGRSGTSDSADDQQQHQYVLLPDGTVGLLHSVVKPAVLQPQPPSGMLASPPPQGVPLVLMQHGAGLSGGGAGGASPGGPPLVWPEAASPARAYPYAAPPPPPPLPMPAAYYPHLHTPYPYSHHAPPPQGYPYGYPVSPTVSGTLPPYLSPYGHALHSNHPYGIDPFHGRPPGPVPPPPSPYPTYPAVEQPASPHQRTHGMASPPQQESPTDADQRHVFRNPASPLATSQYGNVPAPDVANNGGPHDPNAVGGLRPQPASQPSAAAVAAAGGVASSPQAPPSVGSLSGGGNASSPEPTPGGGPGGGGGYHGGHFHRHSHSGAESLRSLPSNSGGGSLRGGMAGSVSMSASQQYEATLASPSPRDSLQGLDSPASFRNMARRETADSGSVSFSPLAGVNGSLDAGARSTISGSTRRRPSPLYASSLPDTGPSQEQTSAASRYDTESVVMRVTESSGQPSQPTSPSGMSAFGTASELGGGDGGDGRRLPSSEEPSLMLRGLEMGSPLQRSKMSDDADTPTSRKPSLTSPWSSSTLGPSALAVEGSGGAAGGYASQRDLLPDVVSRVPLYGVSMPYSTPGLYERYTGIGLYSSTGGGGGGQSSFGGFGVNPSSSTLATGGAGGMGSGGALGPRTPSSESLRSGSTATGRYGQSLLPPPSAGGEVYGSAALALTAAILESSGPAGQAALAGTSGFNQLGLGHLHPTASAVSPTATPSPTSTSATQPAGISGASLQDTLAPTGLSATSAFAAMAGAPSPTSTPGPVLGRSMSGNRVADSDSSSMGATAALAVPAPAGFTTGSSGGGSGGAPGAGGAHAGGAGSTLASAANAALMGRLSHGAENTYSPRTRSRIQLMGNDDLDILSSRSASIPIPHSLGTAQQSTVRLSPAVLSAHQQQLQQQMQLQPSSPQQQQQVQEPQQPTPTRSANRGPVMEITGQPSVPTLRLPAKATSRTLGSAVGLPPLPPAASTGLASGGGTSAPSSGHGSPTRLEAQLGLLLDPRDRDTDGDLSQSARSGRSMVSDGPSGISTGPGVGGGYVASGERAFITGGPVVEHRDTSADASAYGMPAMPPLADAAAAVTASAVYGPVAGMHGSSYQQQNQQLPALLDLFSNGNIYAPSPSGSATGYSPLGFGGGSTPVELSNDSFVRFGSMPFSGAASPMATANPMDALGSPTTNPLASLQMQGGGSSSGGNSSGGGAAGSSGGGHTAAAPPVSPPPEAPPSSPAPAPTAPAPSMQPTSPKEQQQVQLSGMSFRVNSPRMGPPAQPVGSSGVNPTPIAAALSAASFGSIASIATLSAARPQSPSTDPLESSQGTGRQTSVPPGWPNLAITANNALAADRTKTDKPSARSASAAAGQRPRTPSAILSRVLGGRGEFDSDEDEFDDSFGGMEPSLTTGVGRTPVSSGFGALGLRGEGGGATAAGSASPAKPVAAALRRSLAGGSAHDDEFNF